ncbi:SRPBCC domain-containing protein [Brevibacterium aurantiacum]|uniref:SRPBCC domain-containing protein n=1 Tax=Brevibacterium aurantiacum TaxID=273384 RepID=UPI0000510335|nr:SRPBCC domain-containing protein [Brevibacterium aurantiacum]
MNDEQSDKGAQLEELSFTVMGYISKTPHETYEAVADPAQLSKYFTTGGARGRLEPGTEVTWDFADFPGRFPVEVIESVQDEKIVVAWEGSEHATAPSTTTTFEFSPVDDGARTLVTVTEKSWKTTVGGAEGAFGNCMGWTGMLAALKAWIEYGIDLREGFYR